MTDLGLRYRQAREEVARLVRSLDSSQLEAPVPACPGWQVQDVVAHLAGVAADAVNGQLRGMPTPEQTAAQIEARASSPTPVVLREWERTASQFEVLLSRAGSSQLTPILDVAVHEQDIRGAVSLPGNRDTDLVHLAVDRMAELMLSKVESAGLEPVKVVDLEGSLLAGDAEAPVVFRSSPFEYFRSAFGRRSLAQMEGRVTGTDRPGAYVGLISVFDPPAEPLVE